MAQGTPKSGMPDSLKARLLAMPLDDDGADEAELSTEAVAATAPDPSTEGEGADKAVVDQSKSTSAVPASSGAGAEPALKLDPGSGEPSKPKGKGPKKSKKTSPHGATSSGGANMTTADEILDRTRHSAVSQTDEAAEWLKAIHRADSTAHAERIKESVPKELRSHPVLKPVFEGGKGDDDNNGAAEDVDEVFRNDDYIAKRKGGDIVIKDRRTKHKITVSDEEWKASGRNPEKFFSGGGMPTASADTVHAIDADGNEYPTMKKEFYDAHKEHFAKVDPATGLVELPGGKPPMPKEHFLAKPRKHLGLTGTRSKTGGILGRLQG